MYEGSPPPYKLPDTIKPSLSVQVSHSVDGPWSPAIVTKAGERLCRLWVLDSQTVLDGAYFEEDPALKTHPHFAGEYGVFKTSEESRNIADVNRRLVVLEAAVAELQAAGRESAGKSASKKQA